jgi:cytoskeletal protein RodZ
MAEKKSRSRHASPRRSSRLGRIIVTGVVLGLLILGIGALTNTQTPVPAPGPSTPASIATTTQASLPATTSAVVTTNTASDGTTSTASTSDTSTTDPGSSASLPVDAWSEPVANLASLLPKAVAGYKTGIVEKSKTSVIVPLAPTLAGPAAGKATIAVLTVLDKKTDAAAQAYVDEFQRAYPKDLSAVTIGTLTGRFGTDGLHLAAVTFSRGRYAFEIVLTATRGAPLDLKSLTLQVAEAFGATKTAP